MQDTLAALAKALRALRENSLLLLHRESQSSTEIHGGEMQIQNQMQQFFAGFANSLRALREKLLAAIAQRFTEQHGDTRREKGESKFNCKIKCKIKNNRSWRPLRKLCGLCVKNSLLLLHRDSRSSAEIHGGGNSNANSI